MARKKKYVGVTIAEYKGLMPSKLISGLRSLGVEFFEINRTVFSDVENVIKAVDKTVTAFHLPLVFEDQWDFSCPAFQDEIDETITLINDNIETLHIQHAICHPPEPKELTTEMEMKDEVLFENLKKLNLSIYFENVLTVSDDQFMDFYAKAKQALGNQVKGMCFDAPHSFITGHDPVAHYEQLADHIGCVHLSDCSPQEDTHIPFDSGGCLPVDAFLDALVEHDFEGYITLEIQPTSMDDLMPYIQSYLTTLKYINPLKYKTSVAKVRLFRPMINKFALGT